MRPGGFPCVGLNLSELAMTSEHLGARLLVLTHKFHVVVLFHNEPSVPRFPVEACGTHKLNSYTIQPSEKSPPKW